MYRPNSRHKIPLELQATNSLTCRPIRNRIKEKNMILMLNNIMTFSKQVGLYRLSDERAETDAGHYRPALTSKTWERNKQRAGRTDRPDAMSSASGSVTYVLLQHSINVLFSWLFSVGWCLTVTARSFDTTKQLNRIGLHARSSLYRRSSVIKSSGCLTVRA